MAAVNEAVRVPMIAGGGYGRPRDLGDLLARTRPNAICVGTVLHYKLQTVADVRAAALGTGVA